MRAVRGRHPHSSSFRTLHSTTNLSPPCIILHTRYSPIAVYKPPFSTFYTALCTPLQSSTAQCSPAQPSTLHAPLQLRIAWHYLTTWFLVDFVSSVPWVVIIPLFFGGGADTAQSMRVARITKLAKLARCLRLMRMPGVINMDVCCPLPPPPPEESGPVCPRCLPTGGGSQPNPPLPSGPPSPPF